MLGEVAVSTAGVMLLGEVAVSTAGVMLCWGKLQLLMQCLLQV